VEKANKEKPGQGKGVRFGTSAKRPRGSEKNKKKSNSLLKLREEGGESLDCHYINNSK